MNTTRILRRLLRVLPAGVLGALAILGVVYWYRAVQARDAHLFRVEECAIHEVERTGEPLRMAWDRCWEKE